MFKKIYTDEEIIEKIKLKAKELGRTPKQKEVGHGTLIRKRFGSWNKALKLAGLYLTIHRGSKEYFINILKKWYKEHGRVPTEQDFKNDSSLPHPDSIVRKLKMGWYEIFFRYDIDRNVKVRPGQLTDKELLEIFKEEYLTIQPKSINEFDAKRVRSPQVEYMEKQFKTTWNKLKKSLEIEDVHIHEYTDKELIKELHRVKNIVGQSPAMSDFNDHSCISDKTIIRRFGSWNKALKKADMRIEYITPVEVKENNEELIEMYKIFSIEIGKAVNGATCNDLDNAEEIYNFGVFDLRFGSINKLRELAGFKPLKVGRKKYTKKKLAELLLKEKKLLNRRPFNKEIDNNRNLPTARTFLRYFKTTSMIKVWEEIES